jgi:hypothetical protein
MAIKGRLSKLGEARDDCLMKTFERVDAESKKFGLGVGCSCLFGRRRGEVDEEATKEAGWEIRFG